MNVRSFVRVGAALVMALGACSQKSEPVAREEIGETILEPEMPTLPPMPSVRVGADRFVNVDDRIAYLIDNPDDAFARQMRQAVNDEKVLIRYGQSGGSASFAVVTASDLTSDPPKRVTSDGYYSVITIDPRRIAYLRNDPVAILKEIIVMRHEFRHALQYRDAADEAERASFRTKLGDTLSPERCTYLWHHEYAAFWEGCEFAATWAMDSFPKGLCDDMTPAAFRDRLYRHHIGDPNWVEHVGECAETWEVLAK